MYDLEELIEDLLGKGVGHSVNRMHHCPFHKDRHPSFSINLDEGLWYCFSCGRKGNYATLARSTGSDVGSDEYRIIKARKDAYREPVEQRNLTHFAEDFHSNTRQGRGKRAVISFLSSRQLPLESIDVFSLGYSEEKRAMCFPYPDIDGMVRGIKYRFSDGGKSAFTGSRFDAYQPALAVGREDVYIFEGESDTICGWSRVPDGAGVMGTSGAELSTSQWERLSLHLLFTRRVFLVYDADDVGDECSEIAMRVLGDKAIRVRPTRGKDFSEHILAGGTLEELM